MTRRALLAVIVLALPALSGCILDGDDEEQVVLSPVAFLRDTPYPDLVVEVDHTDDYTPTEHALGVLERALHNVTDKRSIVFTEPQHIPDLPARQNTSQLARAHFDTLDNQGPDAAVLHILYVNGEHAESPDAIGVAYPWGRIAPVFIYADRLDQLYTPQADPVLPRGLPNPAPEKVERSVLVHETGHVLGLVDFGTPMATDHSDSEHPRHSANENSVMYYAAATNEAALEYLQDNEHLPYTFDARDKEDLRRVREGLVEPQDLRDEGSTLGPPSP